MILELKDMSDSVNETGMPSLNPLRRHQLLIGVVILTILAVLFVFGRGWAASYYYEKGREYYFQNNYERARSYFNRSIAFNSKNPAPHMYLGRIALGRVDREGKEYYPDADWKAALPHYKKALDLGIEKTDTRAYAYVLEHLGHSYLRTQQHEQAREVYLQKINRFPNSFFGVPYLSTFWPRFLTAEMDFGRFNNPQEALELLLPIANPDNADPNNLYRVYTLLARLYAYTEDNERSEEFAALAIRAAASFVDRDVAISHGLLALAAGSRKDFRSAEEEIKKANEIVGSPDGLNCVLARAYYAGENYKKAIEVAGKRKKTDDYLYSVCLVALGNAHLALKNLSEAKKYYQEYLALTDTFTEKNVFVTRDRARIQKELGKL